MERFAARRHSGVECSELKARSQASLPADSLRAKPDESAQAQTRKHEHRSRSDRRAWRAVCRRGLPARREARAKIRFG